ncbi:hypothetical protein BGX23_011672 [Mortierella sp. AD031]|nr:hypothetical protein BGX23_011672 [Mortierella sp. AD031]KAG0219636.1 hypothetical protein BGX33_001808 [Mortierella sp. NVP41]
MNTAFVARPTVKVLCDHPLLEGAPNKALKNPAMEFEEEDEEERIKRIHRRLSESFNLSGSLLCQSYKLVDPETVFYSEGKDEGAKADQDDKEKGASR